MRISIFGLGYVGTVSAACLAERGHLVIGVDINTDKVAMLNDGHPPIIEPQLNELISKVLPSGNLKATTHYEQAVADTDMSMICVGTPSLSNGNLDNRHLIKVCADIGHVIKNKREFHVVIVRSTLLPGMMRETIIPLLEKTSGKTSGTNFGVCYNPEFLREGSAIADFANPAKTVIGATDKKTEEIVGQIYKGLPGAHICCPIAVAEMVKYADNAWHAAKITFANEIGQVCKAHAIDSHAVMDIFCQDTKLNISRNYLKPGFAFGGSCLPKDVRALQYKAKLADISLPLLQSLLPSNNLQIESVLQLIQSFEKKSVAVLGFSFKPGTDDLRESPYVYLIERLLGKGYDLKLYDPTVSIARLVGANRAYILHRVPHIERLMVSSVVDAVNKSDIVVMSHSTPEFAKASEHIREDQIIIDLARVRELERHPNYHGLYW